MTREAGALAAVVVGALVGLAIGSFHLGRASGMTTAFHEVADVVRWSRYNASDERVRRGQEMALEVLEVLIDGESKRFRETHVDCATFCACSGFSIARLDDHTNAWPPCECRQADAHLQAIFMRADPPRCR